MSDPRSLVKSPAIALIVLSVINAAISFFMVISWIASLSDNANKTFGSESERVGYYGGMAGQLAFYVTTLVLAPVVIYGAIQMMNLKKYHFARAAALLAIVPLTSACCLLGVPFGIWAWTTLSKPEVSNSFTE